MRKLRCQKIIRYCTKTLFYSMAGFFNLKDVHFHMRIPLTIGRRIKRTEKMATLYARATS